MNWEAQFSDLACHKTLITQMCGLLDLWHRILPLEIRTGVLAQPLLAVPPWVPLVRYNSHRLLTHNVINMLNEFVVI